MIDWKNYKQNIFSAFCHDNEWELNVPKQESSFTFLQEHFTRVATFDYLGK